MPNSGGRKRKRKKNGLYRPLSFTIICAAMIFGMSVFFRVNHIDISGNKSYNSDEVIAASGIELGDNLFFINRQAATARALKRLPYIETVQIERRLPNRIVIKITESTALAYVKTEGSYIALDHNAKVLGEISADDIKSLISIEGIVPSSAETGSILATDTEDSPKVTYLASVLKAVSAWEIENDITYIDMSNISNPSFDYLERFTVRLGRNENVESKLGSLLSSVEQLEPDAKGTIDLSGGAEIHFNEDF